MLVFGKASATSRLEPVAQNKHDADSPYLHYASISMAFVLTIKLCTSWLYP